MEPYYNLQSLNSINTHEEKNENDDDNIITDQIDIIDELLRSPSISPTLTPQNSASNNNTTLLFDYKNLNDMTNNNNNEDDITIDHTAEINYKLWLNSNMIKI